MDGEMDQDEIRPVGMKAIYRPLTAMHGSVVDDQEDPLMILRGKPGPTRFCTRTMRADRRRGSQA